MKNQEFLSQLSRLKLLEGGRIYCRHGLEHLLDVCRIAYIHVLERELAFSKDLVYGAGLLHDIGRTLEYEKGIPHNEASVHLAQKILPQCGYSGYDIRTICDAIGAHREKDGGDNGLAKLLYEADKTSRLCFVCETRKSCKWREEEKNKGVLA